MDKSNNNYELAKIALEGENFDEAYEKFSQVLEQDFENVYAWIGKGISALFKSETKQPKLKEAKTCIEKAIELNKDKVDLEKLTEQVFKGSKLYLKKINSTVAEILMNKENKPMGTFQLYAVKKVGDIADRYRTFNEHWEYYKNTLEFIEWFSNVNQNLSTYKKQLSLVDFIYSETEGHFHKDILTELEVYRNNVIKKIKSIDKTFSTTETPKKPDGCFIATEVYGSYSNQNVLILRDFRDKKLKKNYFGRKIIKYYYIISPTLVKLLKKYTKLRYYLRLYIFDKIVVFLSKYLFK